MRPRYAQIAVSHRDRWMASYVDVLTVLLVFFLVSAARTLEVSSTHAVTPVHPSAPPLQGKQGRTNLLRAQERFKEQGLDTELEARGLVVSLPQVILFSSGEDKVSPQAFQVIAQIADVLHDIPNHVQLIGHTDTLPVHNRRFRSNWDLSIARSQNILDVLSHHYGISEGRLSFASYGPYRPAASNDTASGRASNRRVEIVILDESVPEKSQAQQAISDD
jgi:chemotaxis protein MotB